MSMSIQRRRGALAPETGGEISGSAAFFEDMVVIASQDGKLYSFALKDGAHAGPTKPKIKFAVAHRSLATEPSWVVVTDNYIRWILNGKIVGDPLPLGGPTGSTPAILGQK